MRTSRLALTGAIGLALLLASSTAVVGQDEEIAAEDTAESPVVVTGTLECLDSSPGQDTAGEQTIVTVHAWEASDERLSGEVSYTGHWHLYAEPTEDRGDVEAQSDAALYEIVNDGGAWLCEAARQAPPRITDRDHTLVFSGQEGYEGLTAVLHVDWTTSPYSFTGLILPGDEPPYAEPQG